MSSLDIVRNLGLKAARRLRTAHSPLVRLMRRSARAAEHHGFHREVGRIDREIAGLASGTAPILAGPWLAEVGYEVLYWIPFLRWFQDAYRIEPDRLVVLSRGGMEAAYREIAASYVDLFDLMTPEAFAMANRRRQEEAEAGGRKQSRATELDLELLSAARSKLGIRDAAVCHPSLMFGLFRNVWHGNLPYDLLWRHTRHRASQRDATELPALAALEDGRLPADFVAVKLYAGPALSGGAEVTDAMRTLVQQVASVAPVLLLDTGLALDDHRDFDIRLAPRVTSTRALMRPRFNLGLQIELISRSRFFLGTCGGLAWLAPFLGVPTVAVYDNDRLISPHLFVMRQAAAAVGAAEFAPLDFRALARTGIALPSSAERGLTSSATLE